MKKSKTKYNFFLVCFISLSCGPSEFGYVNVSDKDVPTDQANTVSIQGNKNQNKFYFEATPNPARPGQSVNFVAECKLVGEKTISWDFGDNSPKVEGRVVRHSYVNEGQFTVTAICSSNQEDSLETSANITISQEKGPVQN